MLPDSSGSATVWNMGNRVKGQSIAAKFSSCICPDGHWHRHFKKACQNWGSDHLCLASEQSLLSGLNQKANEKKQQTRNQTSIRARIKLVTLLIYVTTSTLNYTACGKIVYSPMMLLKTSIRANLRYYPVHVTSENKHHKMMQHIEARPGPNPTLYHVNRQG